MNTNVKNPFGKYNGNEAQYVLRALDTEDPNNKAYPWVQRFEEAFAAKVGASYAIAVNSGTSALHAALFAAGVGPGDEVIQSSMTVVMDVYATIHLEGYPFLLTLFRKPSILTQRISNLRSRHVRRPSLLYPGRGCR